MAQAQFPVDLGVALADPNLAQAQLGYSTGLQGLQYQQDLAKSLLADSDRPISSGIGPRGMAYRVSPLEALSRAISGGFGANMARENSQAAQALMQKYGQAVIGRLNPSGAQPPATQTVPNPMQPNGGMVQGNNTGGQSAAASPQSGQKPWDVEGQDSNAMRLIFMTDKPAWASVKAASIRANSPTELEKTLAQSGMAPADKQLILQAYAKDKAGLVNPKEGTQTAYNAAGQPTQSLIPGAAEAKGQIKAAETAAGKAGEQAAGYQQEINERAQNATGLLRTLSEMKNLNTNPGIFAGVKEDVGKFFRSVGVSDDTVQKYLKVSPGNLEASQKLTAQMAIEAVRQISNRPTQMEFSKFLGANPNIFQTPEGLKRVVEFMQTGANDTVNEQKEFLKAKMAGLRPENYRDFEQHYNIERQERIMGGAFNSTPATATPANGLRGTINPAPAPQGGAPAASVPTATGPKGEKLYLRNGQWVQQ